jgi:hypothetical protein
MPGLVPGIHVFRVRVSEEAWMAETSPAMTMELPSLRGASATKQSILFAALDCFASLAMTEKLIRLLKSH